MEKMDNKYIGEVFKKDGTVVPDDEWIVFRAQDKALVPTLTFYYATCMEQGCDQDHLNNILQLRDRVKEFQINNPERCKIPD